MRVNGVRKVNMLCNMDPFHFHRYEYDFNLRIRNHLLKFASRRSLSTADRVMAISGYVENYMLQILGIHPSRVRRIYHGSDKSFGPGGEASRDAALIAGLNIFGDFILTVGSLFPYRRCEDVIAAFGHMEPTIRGGLTLVVAGSGTDRHYSRVLERAIAASGVADRVRLVGHVSPETMQALYRCCGLCVIASEVEACPNIAIEAMEAGCVTVASDSSGRARTRARDFSWDRCARETYSALVDW
jgi:glycosyltransferase involved in cell wall biosynthesis